MLEVPPLKAASREAVVEAAGVAALPVAALVQAAVRLPVEERAVLADLQPS